MVISAVNLKNYHTIQQLSPFGIGNSEPLFLLKNLTVNSIKTIGSGNDHLKLSLEKTDAIAFKKGELINKINVGNKIDIIASLNSNTWNNHTVPQLIIKDFISVLK
jgi:single-stranded-DNA-specific exonuclease